MATPRYDVIAKVISQKGHCANGHKVGDQWRFSKTSPEGLCLVALNSIFPDIRVLTFGGSQSWSDDPESCTVACPDGDNPVIFELRRVRE